MNLELTGKVAIVTGSSRGLGLASARALVDEGCRVTLCARGRDALDAAARDLRAVAGSNDRVLSVSADLSSANGVQSVVDQTVAAFGGVDISSTTSGWRAAADLLETTDAEWQEAFDQTLSPAIRASRLAVPTCGAAAAVSSS